MRSSRVPILWGTRSGFAIMMPSPAWPSTGISFSRVQTTAPSRFGTWPQRCVTCAGTIFTHEIALDLCYACAPSHRGRVCMSFVQAQATWNSSAQPTLDSCLIRVLGYESGGHQEAIKSLLIIQPDGMCVSVCPCNYRAGGQAKDVITLSHTQDVVRLQPYSCTH